MHRLRSLLALSFLTIFLTGCGNLFYFSKLGWHQGSINFHSVPVEEVLGNGGLGAELEEKVRFIQDVKRYGEETLGLKHTKNYTTFLEVKGPILYVISACEKDRLQPYFWNFPIIGRVAYKGFFTREDAVNERKSLDDQGYDTYTQVAGAYSTLGWLRDPILSSMLKWDYASLASLILHEMTHGTIYVKGETDFNEQVATFIGNHGAINFLTEKYGAESNEVVYAKDIQEDDLLFGRWVDQACRRLTNYYEKEIPKNEKLKGRKEIFGSLKEEFKKVRTQLKTEAYTHFEGVNLNNAILMSFRRYLHQPGNLEPLYDHLGKDLRQVVEFLKRMQVSGESPSSFLEGEIPFPPSRR